ncbi:alpha/beta hydrolase [Butyrivibrio fibrisolvens]|uniref:alpha/beta hydrolase n=1 Tax=Pseudobutyrivibrio ruminis TaxID=46206 RepID=UPI0004020D37|nr:alpha/beta hydrolase [Pseudobutyrivibrio ruminis]MDC7278296.1 alpha/beta hydrolase [Butyrivibrio fibrisolvens]
MSKKLAVLFPGIGYHNDKPLMYYTKKIASNHDYEIIQLSYDLSEAASSIKNDADKTKDAINEAFTQVVDALKDVNFDNYERIIFVGKSIGTAIMAKYEMTYELDVDMIIYTPIPYTFSYLGPCEGLLFHGSSDPFCDTDMCVQLCDEMSLTYAVIPEANHSLETGDVQTDIANMAKVMNAVDKIFSL